VVEHQTAIMIVGFGLWGLIFVVWPFVTFVILGKRRTPH
jgi:hypothetical protein